MRDNVDGETVLVETLVCNFEVSHPRCVHKLYNQKKIY